MKNLLAIVFSLMLPSLALAADTCESLVITGHPSYAPVAWGENGRIVGAAADMVGATARKLGVKNVTSQDFGSWEKAQAAANSGQADVIFGIYKNAERATYLNYIDPPFMLDPNSVVVRKGEAFPLAKWDDLKGRQGTLIGADLTNLDKLQGLGAPIASIGGAGTFDGIFLTGIIAVLIASISDRTGGGR